MPSRHFQFNVENICVSDLMCLENQIRVLRGILRRRSHNRRHLVRRRSTCAVSQPIAGKFVTGKKQRVNECYENIQGTNRKRNFLERRYRRWSKKGMTEENLFIFLS